MSKYSSDSDSYTEKRSSKKYSRRSRSRDRDRSYSSDSSSSRNKKRNKDKKYSRRDRSKSRGSDKYSRSKVDRSSSYQSKSYTSKSRYSNSPERSRKRSTSRDRYKSKYRSSRKSRSNSRNRYRKSRKSHSHSRDSSRHKDKSPSTSSSSSGTSYDKTDGTKIKENTEKSTKIITDAVKSKLKKLSVLKNEEEKINSNVIDEINDDSFAPKAFVSSKANKRVSENIVIDLKSQTIKVPDVEITEPDSIFHPNLFSNEETRMEKWVKELYIYRQKAFNGELNNI